jgi:hypothetical protein
MSGVYVDGVPRTEEATMSIGLTSERRAEVNHEVRQDQKLRLYQDLRGRIRFNIDRLDEIIARDSEHDDFLIEDFVSRIKALDFVSKRVACHLGLNLLQISDPEEERQIREFMQSSPVPRGMPRYGEVG